jgi:hypothetical protein
VTALEFFGVWAVVTLGVVVVFLAAVGLVALFDVGGDGR